MPSDIQADVFCWCSSALKKKSFSLSHAGICSSICSSRSSSSSSCCSYRCSQTYRRMGQHGVRVVALSSHKKQTSIVLNSYILDTADLLWRMRAFHPQRSLPPVGSMTFLNVVPQSTVQQLSAAQLSLNGSLFMHRAFISFVITFIQQVANTVTLHCANIQCSSIYSSISCCFHCSALLDHRSSTEPLSLPSPSTLRPASSKVLQVVTC